MNSEAEPCAGGHNSFSLIHYHTIAIISLSAGETDEYGFHQILSKVVEPILKIEKYLQKLLEARAVYKICFIKFYFFQEWFFKNGSQSPPQSALFKIIDNLYALSIKTIINISVLDNFLLIALFSIMKVRFS